MKTIGNLDKEAMIMSAGAGVGVVQVVTFKEYIDPTYGPFPGITGIIPAPWDRWSTFGNILIGGIVFAITSFTPWIANANYAANKFLQAYSVTALIGGVANGIFPGTLGARARARAPALRARATGAVNRRAAIIGNLTPTGIPMNKVLA